MSDDRRRIDIPVGVAYGTDPKRVMEMLISVTKGQEEILVDPAPRALFIGMGESSLDFELRFGRPTQTAGWLFEARSSPPYILH